MATKNKLQSYTDDAYYKIKQLILNQDLVPGQKLIYNDLSKRLEMSRTPIINALNRLEQQGLVESHSNRGFTVRPMDTKEAWDTFGVREAIETYVVEEAIQKADEQGLESLEEKLAAYEEYRPNYCDKKKIFLDAGFHFQLAKMTRNKVLGWHLKINLQHIYLRANLNEYSLERLEESAMEHRQLVTAIQSKDLLGAQNIIKNHIREDKKHVIACLSGKVNHLQSSDF